MTKITNELLEDYAMNYYSIMRCIKVKSKKYLVSPLMAVTIFKGEIEYIQLRSIESITDEEAVKLALIFDSTGMWHVSEVDEVKTLIDLNCSSNEFCIWEDCEILFHEDKASQLPLHRLQAYDYLRSIGIATPFRGITVDELVESGKLKLICQ